MQLPPSQQATQSASSATEATSRGFIETVEYDRFIEFCDACRRFHYIGLCYGPPGVGKTLSAFRYSRSEMIISFDRWTSHSRDRLQMNSLEQLRSIFDEGKAGMVLVGMPGIEKRIARFPQFYSRIGFVHEFRALDSVEMQKLLEQRWTPIGVTLPNEPLAPEVIAKLIRMTGGNFRLLTRILTQIERVLDVNRLHTVSPAVVEAARDSLVIGQG